ncbi:hypothetical protein E4T56_gene4652 [Termitomyces sp. T112]|nr:hypothetical protein E4T56_gene4652 [Termitomyces sp. T112]
MNDFIFGSNRSSSQSSSRLNKSDDAVCKLGGPEEQTIPTLTLPCSRFYSAIAWITPTSFPVLPNAPPNSPNPRPPSAPTPGNSDTSSANPDSSLINSDAFSAAVDTSPEFP